MHYQGGTRGTHQIIMLYHSKMRVANTQLYRNMQANICSFWVPCHPRQPLALSTAQMLHAMPLRICVQVTNKMLVEDES